MNALIENVVSGTFEQLNKLEAALKRLVEIGFAKRDISADLPMVECSARNGSESQFHLSVHCHDLGAGARVGAIFTEGGASKLSQLIETRPQRDSGLDREVNQMRTAPPSKLMRSSVRIKPRQQFGRFAPI